MFEKFLLNRWPEINWSEIIFGNSVANYLGALILFLIVFLTFRIFHSYIFGFFKKLSGKTETSLDDLFVRVVESFRPPFYLFIAVYLAISTLFLPGWLKNTVDVILIIWVVYQMTLSVHIVITFWIENHAMKEENPEGRNALLNIGKIMKGILWVMGILFILSNLGVEITSLLAGLGIGGIAIAFALQNILSDLFSSFAIYFDKPFEIGDFIVVGDYSGVVERVGIKTTRIRALQGEEVVISNRELTEAKVQNFKKLVERRVVLEFGLVYSTSNKKIEEVNNMAKEVVSESGARFDRSHLKSFGDSALLFEVVYFVLSPDYNEYMDVQQNINLSLKEKLEKAGVEMAFPTRTVHLIK